MKLPLIILSLISTLSVQAQSSLPQELSKMATAEKSSVFIVDGIRLSRAPFDSLKSNGIQIRKLRIIQPRKAIRKFGVQGMNGAVIISTRSTNNKLLRSTLN